MFEERETVEGWDVRPATTAPSPASRTSSREPWPAPGTAERARRELDEYWSAVDARAAGEAVRFAALAAAEQAAAAAYLAQLDALLAVLEANLRVMTAEKQSGRTAAQLVAEAGLVVHLHRNTLANRLDEALALQELPLLRTLLEGGCLGVPHAVAAINEVFGYGDPDLSRRVLDTVLLAGEPGWQGTPSELVLALQRCVIALDPEGCAARREEALAAATGVRLRALSQGLAQLTATGNALTVKAAHSLLAHLASPTGPDDSRTAGQRQLDALCSALVGAAGAAVPFELQVEVPVHPAAPNPVPPPGTTLPPVVVRSDLTGELLALLTGTAGPAPNPAAAPSPPAGAPEPHEPRAEFRPPHHPESLFADVPGSAPQLEPESQPEPASPPEPESPFEPEPEPEPEPDPAPLVESGALSARRPLSTSRPAPEPGAVPEPPPVRRKPRNGIDEVVGVGPVDRGMLRDLLGQDTQRHGLPVGLGQVTVRRLAVDPTGQVIAVDAVAVPLARLLQGTPSGRRRRGSGDESGCTPQQLLCALVTGLPEPPPDTAAYQPTAAQVRVVRARDPHCTFPGCRRPARGSQLDHRDPYPLGPTSTTNLHPLCKHHHDLKHDGWRPCRGVDGSTTWTSPRGRRVRVAPE